MGLTADPDDRSSSPDVAPCFQEVLTQLGGARPRITLAAATGSYRELLGVYLETAGVYIEIIAHTIGTT